MDKKCLDAREAEIIGQLYIWCRANRNLVGQFGASQVYYKALHRGFLTCLRLLIIFVDYRVLLGCLTAGVALTF